MGFNPMADSRIFTQVEDKTVASSAIETSALGVGEGTKIIPANSLKPGDRILINGEGLYSIPLALTTALTIRVKVGGVTVAQVTTSTLLLGAVNKAFSVNIRLVCRTTGPTGTVVVAGAASYTTGAQQKAWDDLDNSGATSPIDTTIDNAVDVTVQWNVASTTRTLTTKMASIMRV